MSDDIEKADEFEKIIRTRFKKIYESTRDYREEFQQLRAATHNLLNKTSPSKIIHVAGTNGKGSVCAMLDSIYRIAGYRVGLFTSPALLDARERIQVDRKCISKQDFCRLYHLVDDLRESMGANFAPFSYFTLIALQYFQEREVDVIILETGIGGRFDSTNIIEHPIACVITSIALDHEDILGYTIPEIAYEKAGIIKEDMRVFIGNLPKEAEIVIADICEEKHATMCRASRIVDTNLAGKFQKKNASVAYTVVNTLRDILPIDDVEIKNGLMHVSWPARNQQIRLKNGNFVIFDGGHNSEAADVQREYIGKIFDKKDSCLIFSSIKPAHTEHFLTEFYPFFSEILLCNFRPIQIETALFFKNLVSKFPEKSCILDIVDVIDILCLPSDRRFLVTGSLYLVAEIVKKLIAAGQMSEDSFFNQNY